MEPFWRSFLEGGQSQDPTNPMLRWQCFYIPVRLRGHERRRQPNTDQTASTWTERCSSSRCGPASSGSRSCRSHERKMAAWEPDEKGDDPCASGGVTGKAGYPSSVVVTHPERVNCLVRWRVARVHCYLLQMLRTRPS